MPEKIQRIPRGLNELLTLAGGRTPELLEDHVRPTIDLMQFYGLQQRATLGRSNPTSAETGTTAISASFPTECSRWAVLFAASMSVTKTGTMTALRAGILVQRAGGNQFPYANEELGPFGATETGVATFSFVPPYPLLLPPPWDVVGFLNILGTDATAAVVIAAEVGLLS